jgi:hypothetical protein
LGQPLTSSLDITYPIIALFHIIDIRYLDLTPVTQQQEAEQRKDINYTYAVFGKSIPNVLLDSHDAQIDPIFIKVYETYPNKKGRWWR